LYLPKILGDISQHLRISNESYLLKLIQNIQNSINTYSSYKIDLFLFNTHPVRLSWSLYSTLPLLYYNCQWKKKYTKPFKKEKSNWDFKNNRIK